MTGGVRNPNHQVSMATATMTRMAPIQTIGFLPLGDGEIGSASGSTGKASTGMGVATGVTGTGAVGGRGAEATEPGAIGGLIIRVATAAAAGTAAGSTTARGGDAPVGWPQDLQNLAPGSRGALQVGQIWPGVASIAARRVPHFGQNFVVERISVPQPEQTIFFGVVRGEPQLRQNLPVPASALQFGQFMTLPAQRPLEAAAATSRLSILRTLSAMSTIITTISAMA